MSKITRPNVYTDAVLANEPGGLRWAVGKENV